MGYAVMLLSLISCKIVGLELFGVLQLAYFSLSSYDFMSIYLNPLTQFRMFNGLNLGFVKENGSLPPSLQNMGMFSNFINNCNLMLILLFGLTTVAGITYLISSVTFLMTVRRVSLYLLKQGLITLVLFNCFNVAFSAGVHWSFADHSDQFYALSTSLCFITLAVMAVADVAMEFTNEIEYGEFKQKFKRKMESKLFIPSTILYRICLGFYMGTQSQYKYSTVIAIGITLLFFLFFIVTLPFISPYHNYRSFLCLTTTFVIVMIANFYKTMMNNTPISIKALIFSPIILEICLVGICIVVSLIVLIYEIF
jgi:hypothetical protein